MIVKNLAHTSFDDIITCFLKSFKNYFVKMPTDPVYYQKRWKTAKVDYRFSYGMFDKDKLVGFIIHAIDKRNGDLIAFNTGTGVLPAYRGKRIIQSIYNFALSDLKANNFSKCRLEVIKENSIAIKSYQKTGFNITRSYKCFSGQLPEDLDENIALQKVNFEVIDWENIEHLNNYSWDNQTATIKNGVFSFYQVLNGNLTESYFVINPENGYVMQWNVLIDVVGAWQRLFTGINKISNTVKINNVDEQLTSKIDCLFELGLTNTADQYEMEWNI